MLSEKLFAFGIASHLAGRRSEIDISPKPAQPSGRRSCGDLSYPHVLHLLGTPLVHSQTTHKSDVNTQRAVNTRTFETKQVAVGNCEGGELSGEFEEKLDWAYLMPRWGHFLHIRRTPDSRDLSSFPPIVPRPPVTPSKKYVVTRVLNHPPRVILFACDAVKIKAEDIKNRVPGLTTCLQVH